MGKISDRIMGSVDEFAGRFGDRLGVWGMDLLSRGATKTLEDMEPGAIDGVKETLTKLREDPNLPDDMKAVIDRAITPGNPLLVVLAVLLLVVSMTGTIGALFAPINRAVEYKVDRGVESYRMDPMSIITAWRRDPEKYAFLLDDLDEQGWSEAKKEALKFLTLVYPSRQDGIRYVAKEALEPEAIEKYGLMAEFDRIDLSLFEQIGVPVETVRLDWIAHWEHASWIQIVEMLHRGLVTEQDVYEWFRLVEIPPYWRDLLTQIAYTWPTRVDVRRWWDMRTIDETELRRLYSGMGYRGVNLDNYVLWTKVYVAFPDLMARWSKGWISLDQVRSELTALGMPAERLEEFIQMKVKAEQPERTAVERDLTVTDIIMGVKKEIITYEQGVDLLMDMGYDRDEAEFKIDARIAAAAGSPESFEEFKQLTQKYRRAAGMEVTEMPDELVFAAAEVVRLTKEVADLEKAVIEEELKLVELEPRPPEAEERLKELQVFRNRAIAELERVKSDYDRLLAEWRHGIS